MDPSLLLGVQRKRGPELNERGHWKPTTVKLLFVAIIVIIVIVPIGFNSQKLPLSLSWSQKQIAYPVAPEIAMAIDQKGTIHLAYGGNSGLTYANNSGGSWTAEILGGYLRFCGIAVDSAGAAHVAAVTATSTGRELVYVSNELGYWESSVIDADVWGYPISIAVDSERNAHISYSKNELMYATNRGGSWNTTPLVEYGSGGWSSDIAVDSSDHVHIVAECGSVIYFTNADGEWKMEPIFYRDLTLFSVSIALDASNNPHVSYFGGNSLEGQWGLQYAVRVDGNWSSSCVEKLRPYSYPSCSIAVDRNGGVHMTYVKLESSEFRYFRIANGVNKTTILDRFSGGGITSCSIGVGEDDYVRIFQVTGSSALIYFTNEPPPMIFHMLVDAAFVKALLCAPFVLGYVSWWRSMKRENESDADYS